MHRPSSEWARTPPGLKQLGTSSYWLLIEPDQTQSLPGLFAASSELYLLSRNSLSSIASISSLFFSGCAGAFEWHCVYEQTIWLFVLSARRLALILRAAYEASFHPDIF